MKFKHVFVVTFVLFALAVILYLGYVYPVTRTLADIPAEITRMTPTPEPGHYHWSGITAIPRVEAVPLGDFTPYDQVDVYADPRLDSVKIDVIEPGTPVLFTSEWSNDEELWLCIRWYVTAEQQSPEWICRGWVLARNQEQEFGVMRRYKWMSPTLSPQQSLGR